MTASLYPFRRHSTCADYTFPYWRLRFVGGLTVLRALRKQLPDERFV